MAHKENSYVKHRFPGQKEGEQIQVLARKHWIIDVKVAMIFFMLGVFPFVLAVIGAAYLWDGAFTDAFLTITLALWFYLMSIIAFTYMAWLNEELDLIIVTNERVIAHDQIDLFHRQISETNISQIQDVKGIEQGIGGNIFHYGVLEIQTAAKDIVFTIKHASNPYKKARKILDIRDRYLDKEKFERRQDSDIAHTEAVNHSQAQAQTHAQKPQAHSQTPQSQRHSDTQAHTPRPDSSDDSPIYHF